MGALASADLTPGALALQQTRAATRSLGSSMDVGPRTGVARVEMLGGFRVVLGDRVVEAGDWPARRAQELVALLAINGGRLVRDRVIEHLWPHLGADAGATNLRKAAHHARRALADPEAVVLRGGVVELLPGRELATDVDAFVAAAEGALAAGTGYAAAAALFRGELLPDAPYEAWAQDPRRRVHALHCELLRRSGDWERLLELEPTDERRAAS
jgi:DNA-binding SARP family transcriptional activator